MILWNNQAFLERFQIGGVFWHLGILSLPDGGRDGLNLLRSQQRQGGRRGCHGLSLHRRRAGRLDPGTG